MEGNGKFHEKVKENKHFVFSCEATDPRLRRFDLDKWNQREIGIFTDKLHLNAIPVPRDVIIPGQYRAGTS